MNHIEKIRKEIRASFDESKPILGSKESTVLPGANYRIDSEVFDLSTKTSNWQVAKIEIVDAFKGDIQFSFICNHDRLFYTWLTKDNNEYLICAEDLYGGQTVIDLTNKIFE